VIRHFGRAAEVRHAPAESRPREETLNPKNWSHHNRANTLRTCVPDHSPRPVAVGTRRRFSSAAMARRLRAPAACASVMIGARSAARASARAVRTARAVRAASSSRSLIAMSVAETADGRLCAHVVITDVSSRRTLSAVSARRFSSASDAAARAFFRHKENPASGGAKSGRKRPNQDEQFVRRTS
jgi:hypothetical protein